MYGFDVYQWSGFTSIVEQVTFYLLEGGGAWKISRTDPASLPVPPFSPV
jgi:hypothetical protein